MTTTLSYNSTFTYEGHTFDVLNPQVNTYTLEDIATGLSNRCRFGGQIKPFFSVAQHCIELSWLEPPTDLFDTFDYIRLYALLHDAEEAYLPDFPSP